MRFTRTASALAGLALLGGAAAGCNWFPADCSPEHIQELQTESAQLEAQLPVLIQIVNTSTDKDAVAAAQAQAARINERRSEIEDELARCP